MWFSQDPENFRAKLGRKSFGEMTRTELALAISKRVDRKNAELARFEWAETYSSLSRPP
jgi:hypothetical protein